ncbi:hypothetical protein BK816_02675 [Boudabousia tangfeifanii]|uniref:DUF2700 domain-containing protein n=1 Tax=Boudabousia tangfeifanii TaxID=1912795 RepID=A0A1D9MJF2_9ACTO|nr:hypothetical protein [Boudabousia tangfeifanii]AOZ72338.1 hypothetical protein BK816_02675 [Boudabousia tangfeifanii]
MSRKSHLEVPDTLWDTKNDVTVTTNEVAMEIFKVLLPIIVSAIIAVAVVFIVNKYAKNKKPEDTYMIEGLIVGMMFGASLGLTFEQFSFGTGVGVVLGMTIGLFIDKKKK